MPPSLPPIPQKRQCALLGLSIATPPNWNTEHITLTLLSASPPSSPATSPLSRAPQGHTSWGWGVSYSSLYLQGPLIAQSKTEREGRRREGGKPKPKSSYDSLGLRRIFTRGQTWARVKRDTNKNNTKTTRIDWHCPGQAGRIVSPHLRVLPLSSSAPFADSYGEHGGNKTL